MRPHVTTALAALCFLSLTPTSSFAEDTGSISLSLDRGLHVSDDGGKNTLTMGFLGQVDMTASLFAARNEPTFGFDVPIARTYLNASLADRAVELFVQPELAGFSARLLDARMTVALGDCDCSPRLHVGVYRPFFTRSFRTGLPVLALPTRGEVAKAFHGPRSVGITIAGMPAARMFEYYVGIFQGDTPPQVRDTIPRLATARVAFNPLGWTPYTQTPWFSDLVGTRVSIGLNGAFGLPIVINDFGELEERAQATGGLDVALLTPNLSLLGEGFVRAELDDGSLSWGGYVQGAGLLVPDRFSLAGRVGAEYQGRADELDVHVELNGSFYLHQEDLRLMLWSRGELAADGRAGSPDVSLGLNWQILL